MTCALCSNPAKCTYCNKHAQEFVTKKTGPYKRILGSKTCYSEVNNPSSDIPCNSTGKTNVNIGGTTCAYSKDCSIKRFDAGIRGNGPPGWQFMTPACMGRTEKMVEKKLMGARARSRSSSPAKMKKLSTPKKKQKKKEEKKKTSSSKKNKKTMNLQKPSTPASDHNLGTQSMDSNGRLFKVVNQNSKIRNDGTQSKYKAWKLV
jgi:hypothetical protein